MLLSAIVSLAPFRLINRHGATTMQLLPSQLITNTHALNRHRATTMLPPPTQLTTSTHALAVNYWHPRPYQSNLDVIAEKVKGVDSDLG